MPANDTGIDRTEKRFLIFFLILLCLDVVLTRLYPNEFGPLLSTSFVVLIVIPLLIIARWVAEKLSGVGSSIAGVVYVLLLLFLLGSYDQGASAIYQASLRIVGGLIGDPGMLSTLGRLYRA